MIDWGDGSIEPIVSTTPSHTYASSGDYTIKMSGISAFRDFGSAYHGKLLSVTDWGGIAWTSMQFMFEFANHFNFIPATGPNMSGVTSMLGMFMGASIFNQSLATFNTTNVTNMRSMFAYASAFNQSLATFNTTNVTDMYSMFQGALAFNQPLTSFNTANVTNMQAMFNGATAFN
jgi:surface protein